MTLKLVMIRCPDSVAPQRRELRGGEFSIGRGQDNEWVIPDPERHLSKKHCRLVYGAGEGEWELHDLSTNGTFLNQASEPIGKGAAHKLRNGDRIKFGSYEIEVTIDEDEPASDRDGYSASLRSSDLAMRDPLAPRSDFRRYPDASLPESGSILDPSNSPILPPDFDPLAPDPEPFRGPTQPDHAPVLESAFRPPPSPAAIIPDDWDVDLPGAARPEPARPSQPPRPRTDAVPTPSRQAPPKRERPAAAQAMLDSSPLDTGPLDTGPRDTGPRDTGPRDTGPRDTGFADRDLAAAFLRGVGLSETTLPDPEKTLERIGVALRATVTGLRQTLMARARIKDEFRIEQTLIQAKGNNPLKFSHDDDDALATLLGTGRRGGMAAAEAIAEAFDDLRMHELATVSAMQAAVRVLLAQFEPESIEHKVSGSVLDIHPAQKKARAWEAFATLHKSVTQALSDDFDSVFGKAFARAYEQAIDKLDSDGTPS